jgi:DNA invertase Pin-like site-specific DNA recombinase
MEILRRHFEHNVMMLGYTRCSTAEQAKDDRSSMQQQENVIRGLAQIRGLAKFDLTFYIDAGVSASIPLSKRPAGKRMLDEAQKDDVIVASKLDRMFRSAIDALDNAEKLKARGIDLILYDMGTTPITGDGVAKFTFTLLAAVAELERTRIAERIGDGRRGKRERGGHAGGEAPIGYRVVGRGREAVVEPNPDEAPILDCVREMRREFKHPYAIVKELRARGHLSRAGTPFRVPQIKRLIERVGA